MGPIETSKNDFAKFFIFAKIFANKVCPRSQRLCWHMDNYFTLENVKTKEKSIKKM